MHLSILTLTVIAGFLSSPASTAAIPSATTFTIPRHASLQEGKVATAAQVMKALAKFKLPISDIILTAAAGQIAQIGTTRVAALDGNLAYISNITIGSQSIGVVLDTGSSDLWVYGSSIPQSESAGHAIYQPSTTAALQKALSWNITYADSSTAGGVVYQDKVVVGGVTAAKQAVEVATSVSEEWSELTGIDGVMGFAFSSINQVAPTKQKTFFDTVKASLAAPLFTSLLEQNANGTFDFGFIDPHKYTGSITYVPVNSTRGYWGLSAGGYTVGSKVHSAAIGEAILDTGTSLLFLPNTTVNNYYSQVYNSSWSDDDGGWIFPCNVTLPNLGINLGGTTFSVPGANLNYCPVEDIMCFGSLQPGGDVSILGDPFLTSVFTVWDQTQSSPRLGFAKPAPAYVSGGIYYVIKQALGLAISKFTAEASGSGKSSTPLSGMLGSLISWLKNSIL